MVQRKEYLRTGGMPYVAVMEKTNEKIESYLEGIYNTVIIKDIELTLEIMMEYR